MMKHSGFTLIEMAIVMVIIGALIGAALFPLTAQRESSKIIKAKEQLVLIEEAILGFAAANGRLPCPANNINGGGEARTAVTNGNDCDQPRGFIPAAALGLRGNVSCDGYLLDPWNNPYRYSVIAQNSGAATDGMDFFNNNRMRTLGFNGLTNSATNFGMRVCADSACTRVLINNAVAVYYSLGKHWTSFRGVDERQNGRTNYAQAAACTSSNNYRISNNNVYVNHNKVETGNNQFDDIVMWLSPNILYSKLLDAQQMP